MRIRKNKKRMAAMAVVIFLFLTLIPEVRYYKDGGTKEYHAVFYQIFKWHAMAGRNSDVNIYYDGLEIRILGITVYNDAEEKESKLSEGD